MNEKLKAEKYHGLAGVNSKVSPYVTGPIEFLDLQNLDAQMPGALTQRWGSTMYVGQTLPGRISALGEFSRLDGTSMVFFGSSGALYFGATTGNSQGVSFIGQTMFAYAYNHYASVEYGIPSGGPVLINRAGTPFLNGNSRTPINLWNVDLITRGQTLGSNNLDAAILNNYMFAADGNQFYKFDGTTTSFVGLPAPLPVTANWDGTYPVLGPTLHGGASAGSVGVGVTGSYAFYGSWVNSRGYESQIWPMLVINASQVNGTTLGGSFIIAGFACAIPAGFDITSFNLYSYWRGTSIGMNQPETWTFPYIYLNNHPFGPTNISVSQSLTISGGIFGTSGPVGLTCFWLQVGSSLGVLGTGLPRLTTNYGPLPDPLINQYYPLGFTTIFGSTSVLGIVGTIGAISSGNLIPQFLETYQNRLFMAGFSSLPSTVVFSETGEPEGVLLDNNFEVRTNDSDVVTGMKAYGTRMYIFKKRSFHVLSGDNNQNLSLQMLSNQYGALNNRCITTFGEDELLMFLDQKGLIVFNGARAEHASMKVQPYFDRMNYAAALSTACVVHDKLRNQVLCAIPVDGSSINNLVVVYDYISNLWTTQLGVAPSVLAIIQGRNNTRNAFYGSYSGIIAWYGASFTSDSGVGFTCYLKSRFDHEMGDTIQKQYRRMFLNIDPPGTTLNIPINFFQDYGTSKVLQTTLTMSTFQDRLEYGISSKSLAFELYHAAQTVPLRIYGYSLEERMQRKV